MIGLLLKPFRAVWRGWECVESLLFTSFFRMIFQGGRFLVKTLLSPWGLILPITGILVILLCVFLAKQPREWGLELVTMAQTVDEKELDGIWERLAKLDDAAIPAYVRGLNSSREPVFFACRTALEERLTRAKLEPSDKTSPFYVELAQELLREIESPTRKCEPFVKEIAASWARSILRDLLVRDDARFPERGRIVVLCEQLAAQVTERGRLSPGLTNEEDLPRQLWANGEPKGRSAPIDFWRYDPLIAEERDMNDPALFDRFAVERAAELHRDERKRSGTIPDSAPSRINPMRRSGDFPERENPDAVLLAHDTPRPFPEPLSMQHLAAHSGRTGNTTLAEPHDSHEPDAIADSGTAKTGNRYEDIPTSAPANALKNAPKSNIGLSITADTNNPAFDEGRFLLRPDNEAPLPDISKKYRESRTLRAETEPGEQQAEQNRASPELSALRAGNPSTPTAISRKTAKREDEENKPDETPHIAEKHANRETGQKTGRVGNSSAKDRTNPGVSKLVPVEKTGLHALYPDAYPLLSSTDLMRILHHPDPNRVEIAVAILKERDGFTEGHLRIAGRLFHPDVAVRMELPRILRNIRASDLAEWVHVLLGDPNSEVRYATISAFAATRDEKIANMITTRGRRDMDPRIENLAREVERFRNERHLPR